MAVSREPTVDARDREVEAEWSESSAECVEAVEEETCLMVAMSGAL